jgi:hypothetical protein
LGASAGRQKLGGERVSPGRIGARKLAALAVLASPMAMVNLVAAQQPSPEQIEKIRQACRADFILHCSGVQPGGREAPLCLERNAAQLSPACAPAQVLKTLR